MVVMKMKFPFQKRVKLAQGLWLLSWSATVAGALTFSLGCILKAELRRRAEVFIIFIIIVVLVVVVVIIIIIIIIMVIMAIIVVECC